MSEKWRGIIIAESLEEPSLISEFEVYKARISREDLDLGDGTKGRWHFYWVFATEEQIENLKSTIRKGW